MGPSNGGYSNFDYRGTDVPSTKSFQLYDPQTDVPDLGYNRPAPRKPLNEIVLAGGYQPIGSQPKDPPIVPGGPVFPPMPEPNPPPGYRPALGGGPGGVAAAPRGTPSAIPVQGLDVLVLRTQDVRDLEIILQLIDMLAEAAKGTQPKLEVVYLDYGDCNYIADTLNAIFARVTIGQDGNYVPAAARTPQAGLQTALAGASPTQNVYCVALPRVNGILIAAPEGRMEDIKKELKRLLDVPTSAPFKEFRLQRASAQIVATQLQNFWNSRYPGNPLTGNQFRVTFDVANNKVFVQGSPGDLKDAEELIAQMDKDDNLARNDMRIFKLRNALADELGQVLSQALTAHVISPLPQSQFTSPVAPQAGGAALFGVGAAAGGQLGQQGQLGQLQIGQQAGPLGGQLGLGQGTQITPITALIPTVGQGTYGGMATRASAIRFFSAKDGKTYETGYLTDVRIVSNARINALIVSAPEKTMQLIERLIDNLDTVAAAQSYVNVFQLKRGMDATLTANLIAQLFTGQGRQAQQGLGAQNLGQQGQTTARPIIVLTSPSDGASLIDLRLSVDDRTNSLIVAGSRSDLDTIYALITKLETGESQARYTEVVKLRNAAAADVATTVQNFFTQALAVYSTNFTSAYQQLLRNVVIIAEPVSNTVLISATPEYYGQIKQIIDKIDSQPPQVMIQVTIAEVQLNNTEELGVEFGLQAPVLFQRGGLNPGFNFNTTNPLPNTGVVGEAITGFQGLQNLNVGRASPTQGAGGFVFSASSDTFTLLMRALKAQGRVDVLSRPQIQVADNQTGYINVGQNFPTPTATTITNGLAQQGIEYRDIGVQLRVTPRVNPDGKVLMRVEPAVSSVQPGTVTVGGIQAAVFNSQTVQTTVLASDGETIVLGGLISKLETRNQTGIPYMQDIPYVGALFRYRTHTIARREILVIVTPHIVRSEFDHARILAEESAKMKWCLPEIAHAHTHGMEVMGPAAKGARPVPTNPGPVPSAQGYVPGPAYFGTMDPTAITPAYPQPGYIPPGAIAPGYAPPVGAAPMPVQPAPVPTGAVPPTTAAPMALPGSPVGAAPVAPMVPGVPPAWANPPVVPVSAAQPNYAQPPLMQPMPGQPVPPQPQYPPQPGYAMPGTPVYPMNAQPLPGAPVVPGPNRGYAMQQPPQVQPQYQPEPGKAAPPADQKPTPKATATEGTRWPTGNNIFR